METRRCETCGARWIGGQLYWANGKPGRELDLAGLVCNIIPTHKPCANPCRGEEGGQTWESRNKILNSLLDEM